MDAETLPKNRGRLIAVEGIDQSGKRTQARLLAKELRGAGYAASVWSFPDYTTPLGRQLKGYLAGRSRLDYHAVHLLYAANRWEKAVEIEREIGSGRNVIVNRYTPSNLAYGAAHGLSSYWLSSLEKGLPKADVVIILDISPRTSFSRKSERRDVHEGDLAYLKKVRNAYLRLAKRYEWTVLDGERDSTAVHWELWNLVSKLLRKKSRWH